MTTKKQLMTITDFIGEYSISRSIFYFEVKKGALRVTKLGHRTYIKRQDAEDWMGKLGEEVI